MFIDFKKAYDSVWREVYSIFIEFGISKELVGIIQMGLNETCSTVCVDKNLSDMFPIKNGLKQGDALFPLLFNLALEYAIRRVQENQKGLVYTLDINVVVENIDTMQKSTDTLLGASKEVGPEVNPAKTKYKGTHSGRHPLRRFPALDIRIILYRKFPM
jgi:hypothetical protein